MRLVTYEISSYVSDVAFEWDRELSDLFKENISGVLSGYIMIIPHVLHFN